MTSAMCVALFLAGSWQVAGHLPETMAPRVAEAGGALVAVGEGDPGSDKWSQLPPLSEPKWQFGTVSYEGRILAIGGLLTEWRQPRKETAVVEALDPATIRLEPRAETITSTVQGGSAHRDQEALRQVEEFEKRANATNSPEKIMDLVGVEVGMVVGEIGARHGRIAIPVARRVGSGGRVYANDIDAVALALLRERCDAAKITNIETVVGKVDDPLFPKAALDLALMVWTYHEVSDPAALLKNLAPALKPGGTVALVEPLTVTRSKVEADAEPAGLTLVKVIADVIPRDNVFILRKK